MNEYTVHESDEADLPLPPPEADARQIRKVREQAGVSQRVFARYLHASESTIRKWENGTHRPSDIALKLLAIVAKHGLGVLD